VPPPVDVPFLREPASRAAAGFVWAEAPPFLVLAEYKQASVCDTGRRFDAQLGVTVEETVPGTVNPAKVRQNLEWRAKAPLLAARTARLLASLHTRFHELFAQPLALPELPADRRLVVVVARTDALWRAWDRGADSTGTGAEFRAASGITCARFGDASYRRFDEFTCAGGRVQKEFDQHLCAAATVQLLHAYASLVQEKDARDVDAIVPRWFVGGLANFMGGVECDARRVETLEGATLTHNRLALPWIAEARAMNAFDPRPWTVRSILSARDSPTVLRIASEGGDRDRLRAPTDVVALFGARAWAFAHFSWFAHDGKHRRAFLDVARQVLDGTEKPETAAAAYGLASPADFDAIEADFDAYWAAILERKVGRDKLTKQWFEPSTDPPASK
jgi:hypothetical protein